MVLDGGNYIQDPILNSEDMKKLFVAKIPLDASDEDVQSLFENISGGTVTEKFIIRKKTAKAYFGFLTFDSSNSVDETIYKEGELVLNGTTLEVNRACPKQQYLTGAHHKTKKLFVAGIPKTGLTEEELKKYLDDRHDPKYGTVESVQFIKNKDTEENKGFGFVNASSEHFADTMSIQHATVEINGKKLELKKSDKDGKPGQGGRGGGVRGGRGGQRGGYGGGNQYSGGYGGYSSGYGSGYDGYYGNYGGYGYGGYGDGYGSYGYGYDGYSQYSQSSSTRGRGGGRGGKDTSGVSSRGGKDVRDTGRGSRFTPYAKSS